ncbi:MAG: hypothetical protein EXX96DRAFT_140612 [Benjaminiella poitrasii]|nr:MAG: hypothetical protein EXX96DRAFT_140612 [Benjaminiella poitrasii]
MFVYYNVIWIIFLVLLFFSLLMLFRRQRALRKGPTVTTTQPDGNYVMIDINGRQPTQSASTYPPTYTPPPPRPHMISSQVTNNSNIEPPPPSYQDYTKDYRIPQPST